jgi:hypothetical protein
MVYIQYKLIGNETYFNLNSIYNFKTFKDKYKIISLRLDKLNDTILDIEFNEFTNLDILNISYNTYLISLTSLEKCINLKNIVIISNVNLISLPSFEKCINLESLRISYNHNLTSIPNLEKCINLQELYIMCNDNLTSLPSLEKCINLKKIVIISNEKLTLLPKGIQYLNKLGYYKKINNTDNNKYPENIRIPELIHYIIKNYYYYIPIMKYYKTKLS